MIEFCTPAIEDLWFKQAMMADEETMSFNHASGGTIAFPEERWAGWHSRWITHTEGKRYYRYIADNGTFIGEVAYRFDDGAQQYIANVIIHAPHRGKGYGRKALQMLCEAAKSHGIQTLYDDIAIDNPSIALFLSCGFEEASRTDESILVKKDLHV